MKTCQLEKNPLDLREPVFSRLRKGSWWLRLITLLSVDYTLLILAWMSIEYLIFPWGNKDDFSRVLATVSIQILSLAIQGFYQGDRKRHDYFNIIKTLTFAHGLILLVGFLYQPIIDFDRLTLILSWLMSVSLVSAGRLTVDLFLEYLRNKKVLGCNSIFIICEPESQERCLAIITKENRYIISGTAGPQSLDRYYRQATLDRLNKLDVTEVFVSWDAIKNRMFLRWLFQSYGITLHILPMQLQPISKGIELESIGGMTCLSFNCPVITGKDFWIKRILDFITATLLIILAFPIYLAIAIAIKLDSPGPIFFQQYRIGLHGKPFKLWKFRTMRCDAEKLQEELEALNESKDGVIFKIKDDPRITHIGKFLRCYSLDELPQIFNVLFGEMSLVGPRPLPTRDVEKFSERHFIRQEVFPGVTGLWQVSGRSNILDFEKVIKLDMNYIENWSLGLDLKILFETVRVVLKKEGAY